MVLVSVVTPSCVPLGWVWRRELAARRSSTFNTRFPLSRPLPAGAGAHGLRVATHCTVTGCHAADVMCGVQVSNFTEVTTLLKAKGIDLDNNRFLILQGEVEQISMMPPKAHGPHDEGLLEYLEDIIGSDKYVSTCRLAFQLKALAFNPRPSPEPIDPTAWLLTRTADCLMHMSGRNSVRAAIPLHCRQVRGAHRGRGEEVGGTERAAQRHGAPPEDDGEGPRLAGGLQGEREREREKANQHIDLLCTTCGWRLLLCELGSGFRV